MANWCHNSLVITDPEADRQRFQEAVSSSEGDLDVNNIIPMPAEFYPNSPGDTKEETEALFQEKYGCRDLREWRVIHWGTRTGCVAAATLVGPDILQYQYLTAWLPLSTEALLTIAQQFPQLHFTMHYAEAGTGIGGRVIVDRAQLVSDEDANLHDDDTVAALALNEVFVLDEMGY